MNKFADIMIALRKSNGITQDELAENLKVSRSAVGMWETGKREPDLGTLSSIADYFNVSIDYLSGRTPSTENQLIKLIKLGHYNEECTAKWDTEYNSDEKHAQKETDSERFIIQLAYSRGVEFGKYLKLTFGADALELLEAFIKLNEQGKGEAVKRIGEMLYLEQYCAENR